MEMLKANLARLKELTEIIFPFEDIASIEKNKAVYETTEGECNGYGLMFEKAIAVQWAEMKTNTDLLCHAHENEIEHLIVYEGELIIELENETKILRTGDNIRFEKNEAHHATTKEGCKMIAIIIPSSKFYPKV